MPYGYYGWKPYVSMADRRRKAAREMAKLKKDGAKVSPVEIAGRTIARTFWGKAWCENLERYSDFENRLPRGRSYVRNGSVLDLQVGVGEVKALVSGSRIYEVSVKVAAVPKVKWSTICEQTAGAIDSLVELLQGQFSKGVMERLCQERTGLFPEPSEIKFSCSCPDWAWMCKHVAAALYGIGARLDERPELLFKLRRVNERDLIAKAGKSVPLTRNGPAAEKVLATDDLSEIFGLDMAGGVSEAGKEVDLATRTGRARAKNASSKKAVVRKSTPKETSAKKSAATRKAAPAKNSKAVATKKTAPAKKSKLAVRTTAKKAVGKKRTTRG